MIRQGRFSARGKAFGPALVLVEPLSFYGGVNVATGDIIDHSHPDLGANVSGRVLVMPSGRGSSSSSSVLAELIRARTGPAAIVLARPDPIMTVGCLVAEALYGLTCPLAICDIDGVATGDLIQIDFGANGSCRIEVQPAPCLRPNS